MSQAALAVSIWAGAKIWTSIFRGLRASGIFAAERNLEEAVG